MSTVKQDISINTISEKVFSNQRISCEEALYLYNYPNLTELAILANHRRQQKVPGNTVTYIIGRILNYTNVCWVRCKFCAFYRTPKSNEGYLLSDEEILAKVKDTVDKGGIEILFQGGCHPDLKIDYFENIFKKIKSAYPEVILHSLSPAEIIYTAHRSKISTEECLSRLKEAGLHSIPGAGGEILVDRVRKIISPYKDTTAEWLECMHAAAKLGIRSTASMMYGHVETYEERVEHMKQVRDLQDEYNLFRAFISWNFQPEETDLQIPEKSTAYDYLRNLAVSRIYLDNIDNFQLSILTQGPKTAQVALGYGANDFGSTMIEENVVSAKGSKHILDAKEFERLIKDAQYEPKRRNTRYEIIEN